MNELDVRALVREAVARHFGPQGQRGPAGHAGAPAPALHAAAHGAPSGTAHASHTLYLAIVNTTDECVIEPSATCDHCGYCKSHGH